MKFEICETKMKDGDKVWDVNLFPNTRPGIQPKCIFTCNTEQAANSFFMALNDLIQKFTLEDLDG